MSVSGGEGQGAEMLESAYFSCTPLSLKVLRHQAEHRIAYRVQAAWRLADCGWSEGSIAVLEHF
jgi:hypothetical protein